MRSADSGSEEPELRQSRNQQPMLDFSGKLTCHFGALLPLLRLSVATCKELFVLKVKDLLERMMSRALKYF